MSFSDLYIKSRIRNVLAAYWVDLGKIGFDCCAGTVRFRGELIRTKTEHFSEATVIEALESEIKRIPGVRKVYFMGLKLRG